MADKTKRKQRGPGKPWPKGTSGNPKGRPQGSRHKATLAALALLDGEAEALTRKAVELALEGDTTALRLCLERLAPPAKDRPLDPGAVKLPPLEPGNLTAATSAILEAVAAGRLTPGEGQTLAGLVEQHRKAVELVDVEGRLAAIEAKLERGMKP